MFADLLQVNSCSELQVIQVTVDKMLKVYDEIY
jgi:hypothetical protein